MNKSYKKLLKRSVYKTKARFFSILAIVTVGVGFLSGLLATTPDMQYTVDKYYDDYSMFDVYVKGTLGMTDDDVKAIADLEGVERVMPCYCTDLNVVSTEGTFVTRIYGVPMDRFGQEGFLNGFELTSGRLPENSNECVLASLNGYIFDFNMTGKTFKISTDNKNYDELYDTYSTDSLTVVGIATSPQYMSIESEPSTVGIGRVEIVAYAPQEFYSLEVYTDVYITLTQAKVLNGFSDEYSDLVERVTDKLVDLGVSRSEIRYKDVVGTAREELADANVKLNEARQEVEDAKVKLNNGKADLIIATAKLADAQKEVDDKTIELNDGKQKLAEGEKKIADAKQQLDDEFQTNYAKLNAARPYLGEAVYQAQLKQLMDVYDQVMAEITSNESELDDARKEIEDGEVKLKEAQVKIDDAKVELTKAQADVAQAEIDIEDAEKEIAEKQAEVDDATVKVDDVEYPEWYTFDRDDLVGFVSYKGNSEKIAAIAKVFPIFFFFVAALVALTTMTRMVEEERGQIGTLKALGYTSASIAKYYIFYSVFASLCGGILGVIFGFNTLPRVIANAYTMMYYTPPLVTKWWWNYAIFIPIIAVVTTTAATMFACVGQLKEKPSTLMQPKAPKAGKRILLERMSRVWNKMSFTHKVTARNIFRYKKRLFMTVFGIAGCCALLLTGFGLRDSIHDIVKLQFDEIYRYNTTLYLNEEGASEKDEIISDFLQDKSVVENYAVMSSQSGKIVFNGKSESMTLIVPRTTSELAENITLRERKSGESVLFDDDSLVLTEKLCEMLGVKLGDLVSVENADGNSTEMKVSGISENYVTGYAFMSASSYQSGYGEAPVYKVVYLKIFDESQDNRTQISQRVLQSDNILLLQFSQTIRESFSNTVSKIDYIVVVLIISAAILAIIVLYNLTNINICERKKELATIKVLGFHNREVGSYIFREVNILSFIGILCGLIFGVWLHGFVVRTAEVDDVMFGRTIYPLSYLFAAAVTFLFTLLVDFIMLPKIKEIDMVESMKANE